ncbi:coproporphyrinogen III oxidase, partial [Campylobacter lari]
MQNVVGIARKHGIFSINFDLIYGLPYQNINTFEETLKKAISLRPDRFAIFNYAHFPWIKRTIANIDETTLPTPENKLKILEFTIKFLQESGYEMIGMDHFAKADDELYLASQKGELRRNFQGYTTRGFSQTIG